MALAFLLACWRAAGGMDARSSEILLAIRFLLHVEVVTSKEFFFKATTLQDQRKAVDGVGWTADKQLRRYPWRYRAPAIFFYFFYLSVLEFFGSDRSPLLYFCQGCISVLRATCSDISQTSFGIFDQQQVNAVRAHASAQLLVDR